MKEENKIQNIDHVSVYVRDFTLSKSFYTNVLATIGYKNLYENKDDRFVGFGITRPLFWVIESKETLHPSHVALSVDSKNVVEDFYNVALSNKAKDNGKPGYRDIYGAGYYASFILDEDGNNIEVVFREDKQEEKNKNLNPDDVQNFENVMSKKNFDEWNILKKKTEIKKRPNVKMGDIFWCRFGLNIGNEFDGKDKNFLRPVIIIKKYNNEVVFVLPLTTKMHKGDWYYDVCISGKDGQVILNQGKTIDVKRLENKIGSLSENSAAKIIKSFTDLMFLDL